MEKQADKINRRIAQNINRLVYLQRKFQSQVIDVEIRRLEKLTDTTGGARIDTGNLNEGSV